MYVPCPSVIDANQAFEFLKSGNERYTQNNRSYKDDSVIERKCLVNGQYPFAVVLACSDSRTSPEIFFDQKLGNIFVIRNAGNIADSTALGSIEFAVEYLNVPLVVVVGHGKCGAVTAAYQGAEVEGELKSIINMIRLSCSDSKDEDEAIKDNIRYVVKIIEKNEKIKRHNATVVGAYYDIKTGIVSW